MTTNEVPLIPKSVLWGNPERDKASLSPDGRLIAYVAPRNGALNLFVMERGGEGRALTDNRENGIDELHFAPDGVHVLYTRDEKGDENWHLHAVNVETGEDRDLTPFEGVQARFIDIPKDHPDKLVIGLNIDNKGLHDPYRVDIASGELTKLATNERFARWFVDADLRLRGATAINADGVAEVMVRDSDDGEWHVVWRCAAEDDDGFGLALIYPIWFSRDGKRLFVVTAKDTDTARLLELDLATGATRELAQNPRYDILSVQPNPATLEPQIVYVAAARTEVMVLDDDIKPDIEAALALHPGDPDNWGGIQRTHDDRTWLLRFTRPDGPISYWIYDRDEKRGEHLFDDRPELNHWTMAEEEPFSYEARDGLGIEGYIAFPPGVARENLPAVIMVHGGPYGRDWWVSDKPVSQLLANRGYVAIRVNYRGSFGYGKRFLDAGRHEWARKMHTDVLDAVDWAVNQGYVDPQRVAIYGGSYGGYEALVGVTFTPDAFTCAVSMYGMVNLVTMMEKMPPYWGVAERRYLISHAGDPKTERDLLWERSPLRLADQIKVPLLLMYGLNDPRINISEADQIRAALDAKGIAYEYHVFEKDGHGWTTPEARQQSLEYTERFLAKHLGGRSETPVEEEVLAG